MWNGTVSGRVGADAEMRKAGSGEVCSFRVAHHPPGKDTEAVWFDASIWGDLGANVCEYIHKGDSITLTGKLGVREQDGKTYHSINVSDFAFGEKSGGSKEPARDERRTNDRDDRRRDDSRSRDDSRGRDDRRTDSRRSSHNDDDIPF